jgi:hypothetical protein
MLLVSKLYGANERQGTMRKILTTALAVLSGAAMAQEGEVIGHEYHCGVHIGDGTSATSPHLAANLVLDDAGQMKDFYANYAQPRDAEYVKFVGKRPDGLSKDTTLLRWSLSWRDRANSFPAKPIDLKFERATLTLDFHGWRTLPQKLVMLAGGGNAAYVQLGKPLHAFAERWRGRKTGAGFAFELRYILDAAREDDQVSWAIYKAPLVASMAYEDLRDEGTLDLKPLREASADFEKMRGELLAKAADYKKSCRREQVYYDENAEI